MKRVFFLFSLLFLSAVAYAQVDKTEVRKGNKLYKQEQFNDAEIAYRHALEVDSTSLAARFNLGNTFYKQNQYEQAENTFKSLAPPEVLMSSGNKAKVFHNLGNAALKQKKWQESIDAYKQSLRINPSDDETRTNLAYAQEMLEKDQQNQQNQQNQDQNKDQNQDQQDNKNDDKNDQNKDNKDQDKQNDKNKNDQQNKDNQQQQQGQAPKISPQQAQQLLEAIQADEKNTQEKVKEEKAKAAGKHKAEKNW